MLKLSLISLFTVSPSGAAFVVANSLEQKNKAASNDFNTRVVECRLAALVLAKQVLLLLLLLPLPLLDSC